MEDGMRTIKKKFTTVGRMAAIDELLRIIAILPEKPSVLINASAIGIYPASVKLFVGGTVGSGEQWVSWVHVMDVVRALAFVIENDKLRGPVNVTSPSPKQMKYFGKTIGSVLHRPHWFPVPSFVMKLVLGHKSTLVLEDQHVVPKVLIEEGFEFMFPSLNSALEDLLTNM